MKSLYYSRYHIGQPNDFSLNMGLSYISNLSLKLNTVAFNEYIRSSSEYYYDWGTKEYKDLLNNNIFRFKGK